MKLVFISKGIQEHNNHLSGNSDGHKIILYAHPSLQGRKWYDWIYMYFEEINGSGDAVENFYPAKILRLISINGVTEAVIHCAENPINWSDVEENFIVKTILGANVARSIVSVPMSALVHPLCALPDYGGVNSTFIIVLPKRNWSRYFGKRINQ